MNTLHHLPVQAGFVFISIFAGLTVISLLTHFVARRYEMQPNAAVREFQTRISSWWVMTIVLLLAFWFGEIGATLLFFAVSFAALREFMTLAYRRRSDHNVIAACFYILLPLQYYFVLIDWYGMFSALIPVCAFLGLPIIASLSGDTGNFIERAAKIQWGAMLSIFSLSHVPALLMLSIPGFEDRNILLLIFMIAVVQVHDVLQYLCGRILGGRSIFPDWFTHKSLRSVIVAWILSVALAAALSFITPFSVWQGTAIGALLCTLGFCGNMVMAAIKRSFGIQTWSRLIRGHGGMLDRVDSICFAAPIFFHIVRYYWTQ